MKTAICILLALPVIAVSAPDKSAPNLHVAVFDFQTDGNLDAQLGVPNAGKVIANILASDLSALSPVTVVDRGAVQQQVDARRFDLLKLMSPVDAKGLGQSLDATTLVNGRVFIAGDGIVIAAKVVSTETGQTLGAMVKSDGTTPVVDLLSNLSMQIGRTALAQLGAEPPSWTSAMIVGSAKRGSFISHDEIACVMAIDGQAVPDEVGQWEHKHSILPGIHQVFVRYYDGTVTAGRNFIFQARPGASYQVRYERQSQLNPTLWIEDQGTQQPVTIKVEARVDVPRPTAPTASEWAFGHLLPAYPNPNSVTTPSPKRTK